jgi:hypothetical protein
LAALPISQKKIAGLSIDMGDATTTFDRLHPIAGFWDDPMQAYRRVIANFQQKLEESKGAKIDTKPQTAAREAKRYTRQINNFPTREYMETMNRAYDKRKKLRLFAPRERGCFTRHRPARFFPSYRTRG